MQGFHSTHSVLVRSLAELDARDPSLIDISISVDSIPIAGQLVSPLVGDKANGGQQPPASPGNLPSSSSPPSNPPPDTTSAVGNKNKNANGGGNNPTNSPTHTSGGNLAFQPLALSNTTPTSNPANPSSSPSAKNGNGGSSMPSSLGAAGSGSPSVSNGQAPSASVSPKSGAPFGSLPTSLGPLATNFPDASQSSLGSGSNTVDALAPSSTAAGATPAGERLSGGTIAGIAIVCLFIMLALILLAFRRRSIARRVELRNQWWFNRNRGGRSFSPGGRPHSPMNTNGEVLASRLSARSSFATTFDQGLMFCVDSPSRFSVGVAPGYPPMAEVRERNSVLISTGATVARRNSMRSMLTHGSDPDTQYLAVSTGQNNLEPFTPMSVRPFSPSESFFFPKPPMSSSTDSFFLGGQGHTSSVSSVDTLVQVSTPHPALLIDHPFANPQSLTPSAALSPLIAASNIPPDPFADPVKPEFADIEIIRRPFAPSLDDELMVYAGDHVRIFQIFADGWAFVEKLEGTEGKGRERGLIPLDCLREVDQPLPTFFARKRISYGSDQPIGYAL